MAREKFLFFVGFSVDVDWIATSGRWTFKSKSVSSSRGEARPRHGKVVRKSQEFHTPLTRWQRERVVIDHDPFTGHWRSRQRERVVIDHDPFTSRARPGGVFGSAFPCALPLLFLCARTRRACKTAPRCAIGEASALPLVAGPRAASNSAFGKSLAVKGM